MAIDAFVPLPADGGRGNDGTGAKPSGRTARPARPMMRAVVRMAAEVAALPIRWLWKDQLALGKIAVVAGASNVGKSLLVAGDFVVRVSVGVAWPDGSPCPVGDDDRNDADVEKMTEDRKFRFCSNNRGGNLSKRVKNRTGVGEKGTSELCPDRRGNFEVRRALDIRDRNRLRCHADLFTPTLSCVRDGGHLRASRPGNFMRRLLLLTNYREGTNAYSRNPDCRHRPIVTPIVLHWLCLPP
jgi:hypothetical protein